jgi:hypothetical protein
MWMMLARYGVTRLAASAHASLAGAKTEEDAMATSSRPQSTRAVRITGWVWFAGILLIVGGCFNIIHGFAALERKEYFTSDIVYSNLTFWGWAFILWFFMIFSTPWAAILGVMLNILIVYGLTAGAVDEWTG